MTPCSDGWINLYEERPKRYRREDSEGRREVYTTFSAALWVILRASAVKTENAERRTRLTIVGRALDVRERRRVTAPGGTGNGQRQHHVHALAITGDRDPELLMARVGTLRRNLNGLRRLPAERTGSLANHFDTGVAGDAFDHAI